MTLRWILLAGMVMGLIVPGPAGAGQSFELFRKSRDLTAADAAALEQKLIGDPGDITTRSLLLMYYFRQYGDDSARARRGEHAIWLIENAPEAEVLAEPFAHLVHLPEPAPERYQPWNELYRRAEAAWMRQLELRTDEPAVIWNAASFFTLSSPQRSVTLLERGARLEPTNPEWRRELGSLLSRESRRADDDGRDAATAGRALKQLERAWELSDLSGRDDLLKALAQAAFKAGELEKARQYAETMLVEYPHENNLAVHTHHGNVILGRLAIRKGDLDEARDRLLAAARVDGAPTLGSFGPNMALAKELLQQGQADVVLDYFELCANFWTLGEDKLAAWTAAVKAGEIPDFGANLVY